jgi:hypothetical protein
MTHDQRTNNSGGARIIHQKLCFLAVYSLGTNLAFFTKPTSLKVLDTSPAVRLG